MSKSYNESSELQRMLRAANASVDEQLKQLDAGHLDFKSFKIIIGDCCTEFGLGGVQLDALYHFAHHIAYENGYEIIETDYGTVVEE